MKNKHLQCFTKHLEQSEELKQNLPGLKNFKVCLCVICYYYFQKFVCGRLGTSLCPHQFWGFSDFLISWADSSFDKSIYRILRSSYPCLKICDFLWAIWFDKFMAWSPSSKMVRVTFLTINRFGGSKNFDFRGWLFYGVWFFWWSSQNFWSYCISAV